MTDNCGLPSSGQKRFLIVMIYRRPQYTNLITTHRRKMVKLGTTSHRRYYFCMHYTYRFSTSLKKFIVEPSTVFRRVDNDRHPELDAFAFLFFLLHLHVVLTYIEICFLLECREANCTTTFVFCICRALFVARGHFFFLKSYLVI